MTLSVADGRRAVVSLLLFAVCTIGACGRAETDAAQTSPATSASSATGAVVPDSIARRATVAAADTDDFGQPLPIDAASSARIVSLNPTATEVLFAIGANDRLVGRSRWDEFPAEVSSVPSVGDGIRPNIEAVLATRPTLVLLYATAENRAAAEAFRRAGVRTVALRVDRIADFMRFTERMGVLTGRQAAAIALRDSVSRTLDAVRVATRGAARPSVAWPVWLAPSMVIGGGSFLDELVEIAGGVNVFHDMAAPSPSVSIEEIAKRNPDYIVTAADVQRKLQAAAGWSAVSAVRQGRWITVDPDLTGRPSVVLGMAAVALARGLHPELASSLPK